jgi:peptidoglycan DL-endopeptidase RipA
VGEGAVRGLIAGTLAAAAMVGTCGTSAAVPPPPNPSDAEIDAGRQAVDAKAGQVGQLANRLAAAEARLANLESEVELKLERANKAMVDLRAAREAATQAEGAAVAASREADAAADRVAAARKELDGFIAASYQQGSMIGSVSAYLGATSPQDLLARQELLTSLAGSQLNALHLMEQAQVEQANKDAAAKAALLTAQQKRDAATRAEQEAVAARVAAEQARGGQAMETAQLTADKDQAEQQLFTAQEQVAGLRDQRQRYQDWLARKQRDDAAAQVAYTAGSRQDPAPATSRPASPVVEQVIARAMSQVGVPYAWGGGNADGPTLGIHDGGEADTFGDYRKVGFDCSGLMMYAFAGVVSLPHYSGYQYTAGRHVPLAQMRRGDLLFWGREGAIHHVALYLGDGMMIEAPQSGMSVRVTRVRYGDIMPNATRLVD